MNRDEQKNRLIALLQTPYTIEEIIEETGGGNYYTIYRIVQELKDDGSVEEMPFRRGRRLVYVSTNNPRRGVVLLKTQDGAKPMGAYLQLGGVHQGNVLRGAMAYLWRRDYHIPPVGVGGVRGQEDVTKWRGEWPAIKVKEHVRALRKAFEGARMVCDQLLVSDVWGDDGTLLDKVGDIPDVVLVLEAAEWYEKTMRSGSRDQ